ncbi:hypothetical protein T01_13359 [Trichinella spiralis]|uniref:Uncharacterized protein n=1 Tax=Trichinella spiralis TaxID=6334 RepID=A0A0V1AIE5_TRISP|nr:hypothetical protein T01_13359 [Trichinella spiralis]
MRVPVTNGGCMTELGPEMEVRGGEDGEEVFSVRVRFI